MLVSQAIRLVRLLRRYRVNARGKSVWNTGGRYVPQHLIPIAPREVTRAVHRIMEHGRTTSRVQSVPLSRVWSFQRSLRFASLMFQVRQLTNSQKGYYRTKSAGGVTVKRETDLPVLFCWKGKYVLWNGNHRVTAGLILGLTRMRCKVYRIGRGPRSKRPSESGGLGG